MNSILGLKSEPSLALPHESWCSLLWLLTERPSAGHPTQLVALSAAHFINLILETGKNRTLSTKMGRQLSYQYYPRTQFDGHHKL